jgi:hypothetical protein
MLTQCCFLVTGMLENSNGKLLIYASRFISHKKRLKSVSIAAEKMAKLLKLNFEVVTFGEKITPIYVYYKSGDEEPIPLYCDKGGKVDIQEIYAALRNMMFVLSFHPKHSALRQIRNGIMQFS